MEERGEEWKTTGLKTFLLKTTGNSEDSRRQKGERVVWIWSYIGGTCSRLEKKA